MKNIEKIAKKLFKSCYEAHSFCKKYPNCSMPERWADLPDKIKQNYMDEARKICQLFPRSTDNPNGYDPNDWFATRGLLKPQAKLEPKPDKGRLLDEVHEIIYKQIIHEGGDELHSQNIARELAEKIVSKVASIVRQEMVEGMPFKRTIIGEERSMPKGTTVWFITDGERQELKRKKGVK